MWMEYLGLAVSVRAECLTALRPISPRGLSAGKYYNINFVNPPLNKRIMINSRFDVIVQEGVLTSTGGGLFAQ